MKGRNQRNLTDNSHSGPEAANLKHFGCDLAWNALGGNLAVRLPEKEYALALGKFVKSPVRQLVHPFKLQS
jgi:hypothetical protein